MKTTQKVLKIVALVLNWFNLLMFFAMRLCWSGISKTLGYKNGGSQLILDFPIYVCVLLLGLALATLILALVKKEGRVWPVVFTVTGVIFTAAVIVIIKLGALDYMRFVWVYFFRNLAAAAVVIGLMFLIFCYPKTKASRSPVFKGISLGVILLVAGLLLTKFNVNYISCEPVVYAVEDEYQIVFSTNAKALGWVKVNGAEYYDLYNGSEQSSLKVHKISVPMEVLDRAGSYEIYTQKVAYRGPFGGLLGRVISRQYAFRAPDFSDGIQYMSFSDIHMNKKAALATEEKAPAYDFLVMAGDSVSVVNTFQDANYVNELCFAMTGGEIPVVYARGNHEVKGDYAEQLDRFVGSENGRFYYTVHLKNAYILVLDIGEDHDDDWWEFYGTAVYDQYRADQLSFMQEELDKGDYLNYDYRLCVCHIPIVYVNYRHDHVETKKAFTAMLNRFDLDMAVCGHQHEVLIFEPGLIGPEQSPLVYNPAFDDGTYKGYLTDFNFWNLMIGAPGFTQSVKDDDKASQISLFIEAKNGEQVCYWLNSRGEKIDLVNPFNEKQYGKEIRIKK